MARGLKNNKFTQGLKVCKLPRNTKKRLKNMENGVKKGGYDSSEMRIYEVRKDKHTNQLRVSHMTLG